MGASPHCYPLEPERRQRLYQRRPHVCDVALPDPPTVPRRYPVSNFTESSDRSCCKKRNHHERCRKHCAYQCLISAHGKTQTVAGDSCKTIDTGKPGDRSFSVDACAGLCTLAQSFHPKIQSKHTFVPYRMAASATDSQKQTAA